MSATPLTAADIKVGRVYAAKRPASVGFYDPLVNDRSVLYIDSFGERVQYDSPTVAFGRKQPIVTMAQFLNWAKADVTDQCPEGEWRSARATTKDTQP
jgi:hypothetical protein